MGLFRRRSESVTPHVSTPVRADVIAIADAVPRQRICVIGQVARMRARPATGIPSLAVTISDDTGSMVAVWTGRRAIGGITLGRTVLIEGVARPVGDRLEMTNPLYTLLP